jgi:hypothetical protein
VTRRLVALVLAVLLLVPPVALAQSPPPAAGAAPGPADGGFEGAWPREMNVNGAAVLIYQPQIDKWDGNQFEARAAVAVRPPGAPQPSFGVIWISARTDVDKERGLVTLHDIKVPRVSFPASPGRNQDFLRIARQHVPAGVRTIALDQLEANLAISRAETAQTAAVPVVNTTPRIIVSASPAALVRIDGQPSMRQVPGGSLLRVINTRALILLDPSTGWYYLAARGRWLAAHAIEGSWALAANPPAALDAVKRAAVAPPVDLLDLPAPADPQAPLPTIYVSTVPAELIETTGPPTWSPVPGTELLYATNTQAHIFLELKTQSTYVLISGRWFRARSTDGPWEYVPGGQLPPDFAKIPEGGASGVVLASVPGTSQAQEAVIANSIPQTATVTRAAAHFTATYDGPPQWRPIAGTPLAYAANAPTPIIRVDAKTYYALYNGVWFVTAAPPGPWVVAATVPAVVYTIPVTSPLHYVTYARVYGATPTVVYVGYTPGYLGTVVAPDGVVVYGTGVIYTPWVGTVWYPPPPTYGAGAGFAWGATTGFIMGAATGAAMWGCCAGSTTYNTNVNVNKTTYNSNGSNVYNSWSKTTVSNGDKGATVYQGPNTKVATNNQNNNVYASHDGNVYKKQDGSWDKWDGGGSGWQPVNTNTTSSSSQNPGGQRQGTQPSTAQQPAAQQGSQPQGTREQNAQQQAAQRQGGQSGQPATGQQALGSSRQGGAQAGSGQGQRGSGGGFGQRFGGRSAGGMQGLEGESEARDRGFQRFSGSRGGGFRR